MRRAAWLLAILVWSLPAAAGAGIVVEVRDPRYFERQQAVIFPKAEVKLVTFEFEAVSGDERGKQRARALHDSFLAKIHDLHGGAIITYVTPPGQKIENYRVTATEVASRQKAQMVLWGRVLVAPAGAALINARLMLVEPPPGISGEYRQTFRGSSGVPVEARGVVEAPVSGARVDFSTLEDDVTPLAYFLAGLARYYKAAVREGGQAVRWLNSSIADFKEYVRRVPEERDAASLAQAHLYLARGYTRLAAADRARAAGWLRQGQQHAERAAALNPYDASAPTVRAVIAASQGAPLPEVRAHLVKAATLAPTDATTRVNLAMVDAAQGKVDEAQRQLDNASVIYRAQQKEVAPAVKDLRQQLEEFRRATR